MVWTPPKKKLKGEKAIAHAREMSTPLWIRSKPMFRAEIEDEGSSVVTVRLLDPVLQQKNWLIAAFDPLGPANVLQNFKTIFARYTAIGLDFMTVIPLPAGALGFPPAVAQWIEQSHWPHIILGDPGSLHARTLGFTTPRLGLLLLQGGKPMIQWASDKESFHAFELKFQKFLRQADPGLPLHDPDEAFFKL